jgi:hypothetical protein
MPIKNKSEIISRFLTPAIKFWLRSQLETVENLEIKIAAGDRQILKGKIDEVFLQTTKVIYQGIHVSQAEVSTQNIAVNLGGILRGKPLRLLQPIFVQGNIHLIPEDLHISISSDLLSQGLVDLVAILLESQEIFASQTILEKYQFQWQNLTISPDKFSLTANLIDVQQKQHSLILRSGLTLKSQRELLFNPIHLQGIPDLDDLIINDVTIDLGSHVELAQLTLTEKHLYCSGRVKVIS